MSAVSDLPPLAWLRAFESSARHLSFTRAAGELNLTQSAVSQHVRNLEVRLGRELFVRKARSLELTESGANYLPIIREAFDIIANGTRAFTGDRGRHLIIQCNLAFSVFWLTPRLARLREKYPWIVLNIITPIWDPERSAAQVALEIRFGRSADMSASAQRITNDRFYPVCALDMNEGKPDLDRAALFDVAGVTGSWDAWYSTQGRQFTRNNAINRGSTFIIPITAALYGAGIAMAHDSLVDGLISEGRLVAPFDHKPPLSEGYFLLPPAAHAQTPATRDFTDWLWTELKIK